MKILRFFDKWQSKLRWFFDRTFSEKSTSQIAWLIGIIVVVFILIWALSYPFSEKLFEDSTPSMSRPVRIISLLINPGAVSEVNPTMRIFAILVAVIGIIVLSGFLITVLSNMLERHVEHFRNGDIHYTLKNHIIIIGFNEHTISLLKRLIYDKGKSTKLLLVSGIQTSIIREKIEAEFSKNIWKQIIYYSEDISSYDSLRLIDSNKAKEIYVLGDSYVNDNIKIHCIDYLLKINKELNAPLIPCYLFLESNTTLFIIKQKGLTQEWGKILRVIPVNIAENWAKKILIFGDKFGYSPIKIIGSKGHNRLIIIGLTAWGKALAEVFARMSHIPLGEISDPIDCLYYPSDKYIGYTTITFIDDNIDLNLNKYRGAYNSFFEVQRSKYIDATQNTVEIKTIGEGNNFLDVSFEFIKGNIYNQYIRDYIASSSEDDTYLAICSDDDNENIEMAIQLPDAIYERHIPIYVKQQYDDIITKIINTPDYSVNNKNNSESKYFNIYPFGMINNRDILFDNDDKYVEFISSTYMSTYNGETKSTTSTLIMSPNKPTINRYIERLYQGYYIFLLWEQMKNLYDISEIDRIFENSYEVYMEIEHQRWCVNKLLSGISSTCHEDKSFYANNYIVAYEALDDDFKQYLTDIINYIDYLKHNSK